MGTIVHFGVEKLYRGEDPIAAIEYDAAASRESGLWVADEKGWQEAYNLAKIMLEGYVEWLAEEQADANWTVLDVEKVLGADFILPTGRTIRVVGKADALKKHDLLGTILLEDTKTVQTLDQAGRQLQVDDQLLTYAVLLRMGEDIRIDGAHHNMLRKVKRTARSTPPFYGRVEVSFNDTQLRNHYRHMVSTLTAIDRAWTSLEQDPSSHHDVAPPNPTRDCSWDCPFLGVCPMADDGSDVDGALAALFKIGDPIPYLNKEAG